MADYKLTIPDGANQFDYGTKTYKAGDSYETSDACDAIGFYNAAKGTNPEIGRTDNTPDFWKKIDAKCQAQS